MTTVKADFALIDRAGERFLKTAQSMADGERDGVPHLKGDGFVDRITTQTAISINADKGVVKRMITDSVAQSLKDIAGTKKDPTNMIVGLCFEALNMGWLIRDEQLIAEAQDAAVYDAPPVDCPVDQTTLRAVGAKFCPKCGVIRVLHDENLSGVEVDGD